VGSRKKTLAVALTATALLAAGATAATPRLPQIKVSIAAPRCAKKPTTTAQLMACATRRVVRSSMEINKRARRIWGLLKTAAPRTRFANAERAWFAYRGTTCKSRSDALKAGSRLSLRNAECIADLNRVHARELGLFEAALRKR
jgi:uncharacterized protein YecT (DUF1311 family)